MPARVIERCRELARFSEEKDRTTRTFLSPPMHDVHRTLRGWMERLGMEVWVDAAGNLRGLYPGREPEAGRLLIGSHVDTVPGAGAFDGVLGVVLAIALLEALQGRRLKCAVEIVAFSEEEGVRFGIPFLGSRALVGTLDSDLLERKDAQGVTVAEAIRNFGLDPCRIGEAALSDGVLGYFEFHIEQGPMLDSLALPLGVVDAIAGQSRLTFVFRGQANHAGTTPMHLRRDALSGAAEWILTGEHLASRIPGLVATVGRIGAKPGVGNVVPGEVEMSLDVRHADDAIRADAVEARIDSAQRIAARRNLQVEWTTQLDQQAVPCNPALTAMLGRAVAATGFQVHRLTSGAGHDAMILAQKVPVAMLFLRSPLGISHHPDETVRTEDVAAAITSGLCFLNELDRLA
jgi:allantoate deiminase